MLLRRIYQSLSTLAFVAVLSACAVAPKPISEISTDAFSRSGRFALSVDQSNGKKDAVQGGFSWYETSNQLQLDLNNPMGTVLARVTVNSNGASLHYPDGRVEYAHSPDALIKLLLGYEIPVAGMRDWLRGSSGTSPTAEIQEKDGQLSYFEQEGWRVRLLRYDDIGPRLLQMNRNQAQQDISVRVVVDY